MTEEEIEYTKIIENLQDVCCELHLKLTQTEKTVNILRDGLVYLKLIGNYNQSKLFIEHLLDKTENGKILKFKKIER